MMKNKKGTIILSIILAVQFIVPLSIWGYETYKNKALEEKGETVKLSVDTVYYDERGVIFKIDALEELMYGNDNQYIAFENEETGFSKPVKSPGFPANDLYISANRLYNWYSEDWGFKYQTQTAKEDYDYGYIHLYNREIEQANIKNGFSEGPETQAYAVFKIYKNRFEVVSVYIDGMPVESVIEKYSNNEWDASRYEEHYINENGAYIYYDSGDYYKEYYDEELNEYVTEAIIA